MHIIQNTLSRTTLILLVATVSLMVSGKIRAQEDAIPAVASKDWLYLENEHLKVGILKSHGAAIGYLSAVSSDKNLLNHYDHGRLIQQSYYGDKDDSKWVDQAWRYNPVQGGDYRGLAARLDHIESTTSSAYTSTTPRHWANGALLEDCKMEQWTELIGTVVKIRMKFTYQGKLAHQVAHQETPAVFIAPELQNLTTYEGTRPWLNEPLTQRVPGWPNEAIALSEHWCAYSDEAGQGVGIFVPDSAEATCYRFLGGSGSDCSYVAPLMKFALTPGLVFEYEAYLTLGDVASIRHTFYELHSQIQARGTPTPK